MLTRHLAIAMTAAFAVAVLSGPGWTQTPQGAPSPTVERPQATKVRAKKPRIKRAVRRPAGGQIACTPAGCHRIPPGGPPTQGYLWNGMPSGSDVVVCP